MARKLLHLLFPRAVPCDGYAHLAARLRRRHSALLHYARDGR